MSLFKPDLIKITIINHADNEYCKNKHTNNGIDENDDDHIDNN